jgi:predicted amidohydrolase
MSGRRCCSSESSCCSSAADFDAQIRDLEERIRTSWDRWTPRPKRAGWRTSTPAASSTPRAATPSGIDRGWTGASLISGPNGYLLAGPASGEETVLLADIDLADCRDKRLGLYNDALADRRPHLYRGLIAERRGIRMST